MKVKVMIGGFIAGAAVKAAFAATVTLAPGDGVVTNVMQFFAGDTAVEIVGPGTVALNPANAHPYTLPRKRHAGRTRVCGDHRK